MKMKCLVTLSASLLMMAPALSNAKVQIIGEEGHELGLILAEQVFTHPAPILKDCAEVTLDDVQKMALKQAQYDYMKQKNLLDATTRNAWMDYVHTLADSASTKDQGVTAATVVRDSMTASGNAKSDFEIKLFFEILKPEQREPALVCIMKSMKQKMQDELKKKCAKLPPTGKR